MSTVVFVILSVVVAAFVILILAAITLSTRRRRSGRATTTNPGTQPETAGPGRIQKGWNTVKPHLFGKLGGHLAVIGFIFGSVVFTVPGSLRYMWWLALLAGVVSFLFIITAKIKSPNERLFVRTAIVGAALMLALPNLPAFGPSGPKLPTWEETQAQQDAARCPNTKTLHTYGTTLQVVNAGGYCKPDFWHAGHCIFVKVANRAQEEPIPFCDKPGVTNPPVPNDIEAVRSADGTPFIDYVRMGPPLYTRTVRWN